MTTHVLKSPADVTYLMAAIGKRKLPLTVTVSPGKLRTIEQNRLQWLWVNEAAEQLQDETAEEKRAYCKLHFGIPILRNEIDEYREAYDRIIRPLSYEQKLEMMMVPLDYPVTRLMTTAQKTAYLDQMRLHFQNQGVVLTVPDEGTW